MQPTQQSLMGTMTSGSGTSTPGSIRELRPRRKEDGSNGLIARKPQLGLDGSLLRRMVQITARSNQNSEISKFISRFESKKDTKPTASNSRQPSEGVSVFLRKGSVGQASESARNDIPGRQSCRSSLLNRQDPEAQIDTHKTKDELTIRNPFHLELSELKIKQDEPNCPKNQYYFKYVLGKGGFGKVWCAEHKKTKKEFAIKQMLKVKIVNKKSINSVTNERLLLCTLKHPFLVNMIQAFQDRECLYLVMDLLTGGDLRFYIGKRRRFKENETRFYIGCILAGLEYLHEHFILHRDIKPQNLVLDNKGYLRITDLGVARHFKPGNSADTSGTPGYMAPEVMCRQDHCYPVDYYAVGVIAYEMMMGRRPYNGRDRKEIRDNILAKQVQLTQNDLPNGWSLSAIDFINKMIQRKPNNRLGWNGIAEIKNHPWFKDCGFDWVRLANKQMHAPFIPKPVDENQQYLAQISITSEDELDGQNQLLLRQKTIEQLFEDYEFAVQNNPALQRQPTIQDDVWEKFESQTRRSQEKERNGRNYI